MADTTSVTSKNGNSVLATTVSFPGGITVTDPATNAPMIGPISYNPQNFAQNVATSFIGMAGFYPNGPFDLQRTYNDVYNSGYPGFVGAFTSVASFAFGYSGAYEGKTLEQTLNDASWGGNAF